LACAGSESLLEGLEKAINVKHFRKDSAVVKRKPPGFPGVPGLDAVSSGFVL
jgi:hypothetical protein